MASTVTDSLRRKLVENLLDEVNNGNDSNEYYIGIGKADPYNDLDTVIEPIRTRREEREIRNNTQSVKKVAAASFVIPRYNWTSGTIYTGYNDSFVGIPANTYYVLTEDNEVYVCLQQGKNLNGEPNESTFKPSYTVAGVAQYEAFETADGYRWKFLYALSATRAANFLSSGWIPIEQIDWNVEGDSAGLNTFQLQQLDIKRRAIPGQILGVTIVNGGASYSSQPTVTFHGNGTGAEATAYIAGGQIVKIEMNNESAACGRDYDYASIEISGGGGGNAIARPIIAPVNGIGYDVREDLKANSLMLNVKPDGTENGDFVVDNDFRQIGVFRNLSIFDSDARFTDISGRAMRYMRMTDVASSFTVDKLIRGVSSNAAAYIDDIDSDFIYYHQNEKTGFVPFNAGEVINESDGTGTGTISLPNEHGVVDAHSGEVLYIENRSRIVRAADQQEDIKIIITV